MKSKLLIIRRKALLIILVLAAFLRFYKLDSYPISISWDEAAIGYNAYSIAQTQKDEYGKKLPLLFQSFNDYKLPGYIYLDALAIKLFGFSDFSTRAPSAFFGTIAVFALYLIVKQLFDQKTAITAAFLMAINPWHLQLSRAAFESNVALTFVLLGVALLLLGIKNKAAAAFAPIVLLLSLYFYYSPRIVAPIILVSFIFTFKEQILKNFKLFLIGTIAAIILTAPIITATLSSEGQKRVREVSIFSESSFSTFYSQARAQNNIPLAAIFLNQRIPYIQESLKNYFSHFSPGFLFFADDPNARHRAYTHGNFYLFEILTITLGALVLYKRRDKAGLFIGTWLVAGPIAAAFAKDSPHSLRALLMLPPYLVLSAIGAMELLKNKVTKIVLPIVVAVFAIGYLYTYYIVYPLQGSNSWAYGHKQLFEKLTKLEDKYDSILITGHYWKPYIFYLYYNRTDPNFYHQIEVQEKIGKYNFGTTYWDSGGRDLIQEDIEKLKGGDKKLIVLYKNEVELLQNKEKFKTIDTVDDYSNSETLFFIGEWQ